jgi:hypothetical protein
MITEGMELGTVALKLIYSIMNPSEHKLLDEIQNKGKDDVQRFKNALINNNLDLYNLMLDGLLVGISVDITPDEARILKSGNLYHDRYTLLGFYSRARAAMMLSDMLEIIREKIPS